VCHVMKTKPLRSYWRPSVLPPVWQSECERHSSIAKDVQKAAADTLQVYKKDGISGLTGAVSDWESLVTSVSIWTSRHIALRSTRNVHRNYAGRIFLHFFRFSARAHLARSKRSWTTGE
jgi:hypothetical protein